MIGLNSITKKSLNILTKQQKYLQLNVMSQQACQFGISFHFAHTSTMYVNIEIFHKVNHYCRLMNVMLQKLYSRLLYQIFMNDLLYLRKIYSLLNVYEKRLLT